MDIKNLFNSDGGYYDRRKPVLVFLFFFGLVASAVSASKAFVFLADFFAVAGLFAGVAALLSAFTIEFGKAYIFKTLSKEWTADKYADLILLVLGVCIVAVSIFTSKQGAEMEASTNAAAVMDSAATKLDSAAANLGPIALLGEGTDKMSKTAPVGYQLEAKRHDAKAAKAKAEIAAAAVSVEKEKTERLKLAAAAAAKKAAKAEQKGQKDYIYLLAIEFFILLTNLCQGYILAQKKKTLHNP